jgi:anti-anti-sigma factor
MTETQSRTAHAGAGRVRRHGPDRGRADVLDLIHADHARIRRLLATAESAARRGESARAPRMLREAWDRAAVLLEADCDAEEEICYPVLYRAAGGAALTGEARAEHDDIREAIAETRLAEAGSPAWWLAVTAAITAAGDHLTREEHGAMAQIRNRTSPAQRRTLGRQWAAYMNARAREAESGADSRRPGPGQRCHAAGGKALTGMAAEPATARRHPVVALPEQIDACNVGQVAEALASAVSQGGTVTADMSATTFCDCAGAHAIMHAHKHAAASGAELRVIVTMPQVRRLFELLELDRLLDIHHRPAGH